jgi:hypothetical protein
MPWVRDLNRRPPQCRRSADDYHPTAACPAASCLLRQSTAVVLDDGVRLVDMAPRFRALVVSRQAGNVLRVTATRRGQNSRTPWQSTLVAQRARRRPRVSRRRVPVASRPYPTRRCGRTDLIANVQQIVDDTGLLLLPQLTKPSAGRPRRARLGVSARSLPAHGYAWCSSSPADHLQHRTAPKKPLPNRSDRSGGRGIGTSNQPVTVVSHN